MANTKPIFKALKLYFTWWMRELSDTSEPAGMPQWQPHVSMVALPLPPCNYQPADLHGMNSSERRFAFIVKGIIMPISQVRRLNPREVKNLSKAKQLIRGRDKMLTHDSNTKGRSFPSIAALPQ